MNDKAPQSGDEWQAFHKKKITERVYEDAFGTVMLHGPNEHEITIPEKRRIKDVLMVGAHMNFPRCRFRNSNKAYKLDMELGHSEEERKLPSKGTHTKLGHVCAECRCHHTAGYRTKGWWYWPPNGPSGFGEVGHHGVGPCFIHSPMGRLKAGDLIKKYTQSIAREIQAMKEEGLAPDGNRGYMIEMKGRVKESEERLSAKTASAAIFTLANDVITRLRTHQQDPIGKGFMKRLSDFFGFDPEDMGDEEVGDLMEIFNCCPLTEMAGGRRVPMADKTSIELQEKLIRSMGAQAKSTYEMHEDDYFHKDVVRVAFGRMISSVEAIYAKKGDKDDWNRLTVELKEIGRTLDE
jgi:hypothetical protein